MNEVPTIEQLILVKKLRLFFFIFETFVNVLKLIIPLFGTIINLIINVFYIFFNSIFKFLKIIIFYFKNIFVYLYLYQEENGHFIKKEKSQNKGMSNFGIFFILPLFLANRLILYDWFYQNYDRPYATNEIRLSLSKETNIPISNISNWLYYQRCLKKKCAKNCSINGINKIILKAFFYKNNYPTRFEVQELATKTGITSEKIYKWFANQRFIAKKKKNNF